MCSDIESTDLCSRHIDVIFSELVKEKLINPQSKFFSTSKKRTLKTCFQSLYPLAKFFNHSSKTYFDFFLHNSYLFIFAFFLDQSLDSLENNPSTKVRAFQISSYLLLKYFEWLSKAHKPKIINLFYEYYKEQTKYLIIEKKWKFPTLYLSAYGSVKKIIKKEIILTLPLDLCKINLYTCKPLILKDLFINYYSFILLADDLIDLNSDMRNHCLTYPISMYFKLKGELPQSYEDVTSSLPRLNIIETLKKFLEKITKLEIDIGQQSSIINNTILAIKSELRKKGFNL